MYYGEFDERVLPYSQNPMMVEDTSFIPQISCVSFTAKLLPAIVPVAADVSLHFHISRIKSKLSWTRLPSLNTLFFLFTARALCVVWSSLPILNIVE